MDIYVFKRADGSEWADYRVPAGAKILKRVHATKLADIRAIAEQGGRVGSLAERALAEIRVNQAADVLPAVSPEVRERGFVGRLKWLLTGK